MIPEDVLQIAYKTSETSSLPEGYSLYQKHPNPFNPITEIGFVLPAASQVRLHVYKMLRQRVSTLVDDILEADEHQFSWNGSEMASGVYFYRLTAGEFIETRKMMLLKWAKGGSLKLSGCPVRGNLGGTYLSPGRDVLAPPGFLLRRITSHHRQGSDSRRLEDYPSSFCRSHDPCYDCPGPGSAQRLPFLP